MSGLTLRESAETAVKAATDREIELKARPAESVTEDEWAQLTKMTADATKAVAEFVEQNKNSGSLAEANKILNGMGLDSAAPVEDRQQKLADEYGIVKPRPGMTLGQVIAESPAYAEFVKNNADAAGAIPDGWSGRARIGDLNASLFDEAGKIRNTLVTTSDAGTDAGFVEPTRLPGFVNEAPLAESYLWDLCTKIPVSGEGFKYTRLVSQTNNAAFVAEATDAGVLASDLSTGGITDAAGGLKPESGMQWGQASGVVETVAHWIPITRQAAADAPQVVGYINAFLRGGLQVAIEDQIVNGDGTSPNLPGILGGSYAGLLSYSLAANGNPTRFDAILAAIQAIRASNRLFQPNAVLINEADFYSTTFVAAKDGQNNYLFGGPAAGSPGTFPLWGLRVIVSPSVPAGTQLVGDWRYALIADRQRAQLFVTDSHRDFFTRNLLVILAEQRMGFALMAETAFAQVVA